jgi:hypothetical protein
MIRGFADVLALWSPLQLSRVLEVPYSTAVSMYQRKSIGPGHWGRLIQAAASRGEIITAEMLITFADKRRREGPRRRSSSGRRQCSPQSAASSPSP